MNKKRFLCFLLLCSAALMLTACSPEPSADNAVPAAEAAADQPSAPAAKPPVQLLTEQMALPDNASPTQPVYDQLTVAERRSRQLPTILQAPQPYLADRTVYLTFDDGPDDKNTPAILDILKTEAVKATFFVTGQNASRQPEVLKRIFKEGHAIGNHSYNHTYGELYCSPSAYTAQLEKTDAVIKEIIGVRPVISRAPGGTAGHFSKAYWQAIKNIGYLEFGWNISSADASVNSIAANYIENIAGQLNERPYLGTHAIVLMHSSGGHEETVKALPEIIRQLKEKGFSFGVITPFTPEAW